MRPNVLKRTALAVMAVVAMATVVGADAGTSFAASSGTVVPFATQNFGLSTTQAKYEQCFLTYEWGYTDKIDGLLGTHSWEAMQRFLRDYGYTGKIDGIPGTLTIEALQRELRYYGYTGKIDGIAGTQTQAAFKRDAEADALFCNLI